MIPPGRGVYGCWLVNGLIRRWPSLGLQMAAQAQPHSCIGQAIQPSGCLVVQLRHEPCAARSRSLARQVNSARTIELPAGLPFQTLGRREELPALRGTALLPRSVEMTGMDDVVAKNTRPQRQG